MHSDTMVKIKKNSDYVTPADAFRKQEKKKQIERNKKERSFNKDAIKKAHDDMNVLRNEARC